MAAALCVFLSAEKNFWGPKKDITTKKKNLGKFTGFFFFEKPGKFTGFFEKPGKITSFFWSQNKKVMEFENWGWDFLGEQKARFFFRCIPEFTDRFRFMFVHLGVWYNFWWEIYDRKKYQSGWLVCWSNWIQKNERESVCWNFTLLFFFKRAFQVKCKCDLGKIYINRKLHITHLC